MRAAEAEREPSYSGDLPYTKRGRGLIVRFAKKEFLGTVSLQMAQIQPLAKSERTACSGELWSGSECRLVGHLLHLTESHHGRTLDRCDFSTV